MKTIFEVEYLEQIIVRDGLVLGSMWHGVETDSLEEIYARLEKLTSNKSVKIVNSTIHKSEIIFKIEGVCQSSIKQKDYINLIDTDATDYCIRYKYTEKEKTMVCNYTAKDLKELKIQVYATSKTKNISDIEVRQRYLIS